MSSLRSIIIIIFYVLWANVLLAKQNVGNEWENTAVLDYNKEKPHAISMLYDNAQDAHKDDYSKSFYYKSLNGSWKFSSTLHGEVSSFPSTKELLFK